MLLLLVFLGGFGLWGICQLTIKLVVPSFRIKARRIKLFLIAGLSALGYCTTTILNIESTAMIILPAIVTVHFSYLGREYLWGSS